MMKVEINSTMSSLATYKQNDANSELKEHKLTAKEISNTYLMEYQQKIGAESKEDFTQQAQTFRLADIGYTGTPIGELSQEEAQELVSEEGFFGIAQTSERIAMFVINGAGDDVEKLQAGRKGMLQGFAEAEALWGEKLPEISYTTMQKALEMVDARISEYGGNVLNTSV